MQYDNVDIEVIILENSQVFSIVKVGMTLQTMYVK